MTLIRLDWNRYVNTDEISDVTFENRGARIRFKDGRSETLEYFSEDELARQLRPAATILPCPPGLTAIIAIDDRSGKLSFGPLPMAGLRWDDDMFTPACLETMPSNDWAWRFDDDGRVLIPDDQEFANSGEWLEELERRKNVVAERARKRKENDTKNDT